jgi:hypothetical protein
MRPVIEVAASLGAPASVSLTGESPLVNADEVQKPRKRVPKPETLLKRILNSGSYRGKHVILVHGKVYAASSRPELRRLFDRALKDFPGERPTLAYIPEADTLVLVMR